MGFVTRKKHLIVAESLFPAIDRLVTKPCSGQIVQTAQDIEIILRSEADGPVARMLGVGIPAMTLGEQRIVIGDFEHRRPRHVQKPPCAGIGERLRRASSQWVMPAQPSISTLMKTFMLQSPV